MPKKLHPHATLIQLLGGPTMIAGHLGLHVVHTTGKWSVRGIPIEYWHRLVDWAVSRGVRGVTIDALVAGKIAHGQARAATKVVA